MCILGFAQAFICLGLLLYAAPRTEGLALLAVISGVVFFGAGSVLFFLYLAPPRPTGAYRLADGTYLFVRPLLLNLLIAVIGLYTIILLPVLAVACVFGIPWVLSVDPPAAFPALKSFDPWSAFQTFDNAKGLILILIPGLIAFPWLYPKLLRTVIRNVQFTFGRVGFHIRPDGLSVLGPHATFVPWAWVDEVYVTVHGQAEKVVLKGTAELNALRPQLDRRIPRQIRKDIEWNESGVPLGLDFLRVRAEEFASLIRSYV